MAAVTAGTMLGAQYHGAALVARAGGGGGAAVAPTPAVTDKEAGAVATLAKLGTCVVAMAAVAAAAAAGLLLPDRVRV